MAKMGKYCKAYPIKWLRAYSHWSENAQNARTEAQLIDGKKVQVVRVLGDEEYLYLQENLIVTDGIFIDQNIIFDDITDEWKEFCRNDLAFDENGFQKIKERETVSSASADLDEAV